MNMEEKNQMIENYIIAVSNQINSKYPGLIDNDKISEVIDRHINSSKDFELEIKPEVEMLEKQVTDEYLEFKKQIEKIMKCKEQEHFGELATLSLNTDKNGIFLSPQQIDLLMITEVQTSEELKNYVESCGQFPNISIEDIIPNFNLLDIEKAKEKLFEEYKKSIVSYLEETKMTNKDKARIKLEKMGIDGEELNDYLEKVSEERIDDVFQILGQKYGNDFITKINRFMTYDYDNVKGVSYDEMKSLSSLIQRDDSIDTIVIATGTFNNSIYSSLNGKVFEPYFTNRALQYCVSHDIHMRYHAIFDQNYVEQLLKQGKGIQDHDQILAEMKLFVQLSMQYIEQNNRQLSNGSMLINEVEIFNELVERNKENKNEPYQMIWEKYFGITLEELVTCFDNIKKPSGVEFMYNETTLTESTFKRQKVEEILDRIIMTNPNLIDRFGDQMHLSDENVMTETDRNNLLETTQMIRRIQDKKIYVGKKEKHIKTECTEHDFHFSKLFLEKIDKLKQNGQSVDLWYIKRKMQDYISSTYISNGVNFDRSTYWTLFGKNDHNLVRANRSIVRDNQERIKNSKKEKPLITTMSAGLVPDGKDFTDIISLKS